MYKLFTLLFSLFFLMPASMLAQSEDEKLVEFASDNATMEDNPNKNNYNITIYSPDGQWKMQLNYYSDSMFGTFSNADFHLDSDGKYYNYARNPKNDMVFYSFTDMNVSVTNEGTCYRVVANCLTNNKMRFKVEATIKAPQAKEIRKDNLGYARVQPNSFYGTYAIYAENENYKLAYGVTGNNLIGTFYRADMLLPELYDKKAGKNINVVTASAVHTKDGDNTNMTVSVLGDDEVMYELTMYNGPYDVDIKEEKNIEFTQVMLQDLTDFYGCYQFGAQNDKYQMAIAVKSDVFTSGKTEWTKDDLIMQYTNLVITAEERFVDIFDIKAKMEVKDKSVKVYADVTSMDGILYHVVMNYQKDGYMPDPKETVNIDFGHVSVLDYSTELGKVGFGAVKPGKYQMRFYLYANKLEGDFTTSDFDMDKCDMMVVKSDNSYIFHDAKYMKANMEKSADGKTMITVDMFGIDEVLYHGTMYIDDLKCMKDGNYSVDLNSNVMMVALQAGYEDGYGEYNMQLQNMDDVYDDDDNVVGDGNLFSFYFAHNGPGIAGDYSISGGNLTDDQVHMFFERGCEVRVGTVACTLSLEALKPVRVRFAGEYLNTNLYKINFKLLGQNNVIYTGSGENFLLCINEDGEFVEVSEEYETAINQALAEQGLKVRKVLKNGMIIVEKNGNKFDVQGRQLK